MSGKGRLGIVRLVLVGMEMVVVVDIFEMKKPFWMKEVLRIEELFRTGRCISTFL